MAANRRVSGDEGTTLMELVVGMGVMLIFMTIFTSSVISMFSSTNKVQALEISSAQLATAFDRLDGQVRYATVIDAPIAPTSATPSVAFQTDGPTATTCTQLRIQPVGTSVQLVERTWTVTVNSDGSSSASNLSSWSQLAVGITLFDQNGTAVTPFAVSTPDGGTVQQLHLRLIAIEGVGQSGTRSFSDITFSALNSAAASKAQSSTPACAQLGTS
jgi:hypothetical protein